MKSCLILFCLTVFAGAAVAQTCDLTLSMDWQQQGKSKQLTTTVYHDLSAADAQDINTRSQSVLNEATKAQGKGGDYSFVFDGSTTCPGVNMGALAPITGLTHQGSAKVWRQALKIAEGHVQASEKHVAKGGRGPWGNDDNRGQRGGDNQGQRGGDNKK